MREKDRAAAPLARDRRFFPKMRGGARHAKRAARAAETDLARRAIRAAQARAELAARHIAAPFFRLILRQYTAIKNTSQVFAKNILTFL